MQSYENIDEYIANFSGETRKKLEEMRKIIKQLVPEATEKIIYGIPTLYLNGNLVHFAGYKSHIGFYPGAAPISDFKKDLIGYKTSKGTIQFLLDRPLPLDIVQKIVNACLIRNNLRI